MSDIQKPTGLPGIKGTGYVDGQRKTPYQNPWIPTNEKRPLIGSHVETSEDGVEVSETMYYLESRTCMLAGYAGGYGYFGEGFATDGSTGCDIGLICDDPQYWRYL